MNHNPRFDPFDTFNGNHSTHKVPKWLNNTVNLLDYMQDLDEENENTQLTQAPA